MGGPPWRAGDDLFWLCPAAAKPPTLVIFQFCDVKVLQKMQRETTVFLARLLQIKMDFDGRVHQGSRGESALTLLGGKMDAKKCKEDAGRRGLMA